MKWFILLIIALFYFTVSLHPDDTGFHGGGGINTMVNSGSEAFYRRREQNPEYRGHYGIITQDDRIVLYQEDIYRRKCPYDVITKDTIWRDQNGFPRARFFGRDAYFLMGGNRVTFKFLDKTESGMVFLPETCRFLLHGGQDIYSNDLEVSCSSYLIEGQRRYVPVNMTQTFIGVIQDGDMIFNTANIPWAEGESGPGIGVALDIKYVFSADSYSDEPEQYLGKPGYRNLVIMNGYVDFYRPDLFYKNNRVKRVLVQSTDEWEYFEQEYTLEDAPEFQMIEFPRPVQSVRMIIQDVYKGTHYDDTVISALMTKGRSNYSYIKDMDEHLALPYYERWEEP